MFEKFIRFFIDNARMNYLLFILIFMLGIYSYIKTPKEVFPSFDLDMVVVSGSYSGSSIDMLNKMAVNELENSIKNIDGIKSMRSIITPGKFKIRLKLLKGRDKHYVADLVKDAIASTKRHLPSDMNEPTVSVPEARKSLMGVSVLSNNAYDDKLIAKAHELRDKILQIKDISDVVIYGDSEIYYDIKINSEKLQALKIDENAIISTLAGISYIYPIGKIEDNKEGHFFISTNNGKASAEEMQNMRIKVANTTLYLKDVASVEKRYKDKATKYHLNGKDAISAAILQNRKGNALSLSDKIKKTVAYMNKKDDGYTYLIHRDRSIEITDRLNVVSSNIILGLILITLFVMILINARMSFVIMLGIPTSFVIGSFYLYMTGISINTTSLIGALLALGILVDDAIIVSENIQQHIEKGKSPKEAAIAGSAEMFKPVTIASLTTLFAFIPALMIGGNMGQVVKLIPITVSVLVLASLVESFVFLPIHSAHIMKKKQKTLNWEKANKFYSILIHFFMRYKKTFLFIFTILLPILIIFAIKDSKFQMFEQYDAKSIDIALRADNNTSLEQMHHILKSIQKDMSRVKDEFYVENVSSVTGWRRDGGRNAELYPYVGQVTLEFQKLAPQNFVDKYITPNLSLYYDEKGRTREEESPDIARRLRTFLKKKKYKEKFNLLELELIEKRLGPIKSDLKLGLIGESTQEIIKYIEKFKAKLRNIKGIVSVNDGVKYGIDEIKLEINDYGKSLGLNERKLGQELSNMYLEREIALSFDESDILQIKVSSDSKNSIEGFKSRYINIDVETRVSLRDVVHFKTIKSFEKVIKSFGEKNFYIYANVDPKIITANEALKKIKPLVEQAIKDGVKIVFKGAREQQREFKDDMIAASSVALILIMLSLLYLFNSFAQTFMMISVIPLAFFGVLLGHYIMGINLSLSSVIGMLGLSGVVINDGIIMMMNLKKANNIEEIYSQAAKRFRPIILTTITTVIGMSSLMFFPSGQAAIFQAMAIALGFGLIWGTVLNLLYLPILYTYINSKSLLRH